MPEPEPEPRRGRVHDAEGAREAILNAAEAVFAEHGFDGARIDAIAKASGYNKSLLFQYFDDKLGLYAAVLKRAERQMGELEAQFIELIGALLADETIASHAHQFRTLLETALRTFFDYLVEHPRLLRIIVWEQAEGWQSYVNLASQFDTENVEQFRTLFSRAQRAGLLRSGVDPFIQFVMVEQMCWSYLASIPLYQALLPGEDLSSARALARAREQIVAFFIAGMMVDPPETKR